MLFVRTRLRRYLRRLLRTLRPSPTTATTTPEARDVRLGVLLHVAVTPDRRGQGHGRLLTEHLVTEAIRQQIDELHLVTADADAAAFYRRLGWEARQTREDSNGTTVTTFGYPLP